LNVCRLQAKAISYATFNNFPASMFVQIYFMRKYRVLLIWLVLTSSHCLAQRNREGRIIVNNETRDYVVHLPDNYNKQTSFPLLLVFHGGGSNGKQIQRYMGMDEIGNRENFITIYPNGLNKQWNDGREFKKEISANDDITFISQLLDSLVKNYAIDEKMIFATGISNGGFFSIYLSFKLNSRLRAVAPVCASIPEKIYDQFYPASPVSILLINGTGDPLVPYDGGEVGSRFTGSRGRAASTDKTIERYLTVDGTNPEARIENIPDKDPRDGCTAIKYTYTGGKNNSEVVLVKIINGGHTLPGGSQYLPKFIIGKVCNDFKANEMIWEFFKQCGAR
jgi:polyhydroxybutyrate depolymerase